MVCPNRKRPHGLSGTESRGLAKEIGMLMVIPMVAAAGYAFLYLLLGGGLGGAILIFIIAKMLGK